MYLNKQILNAPFLHASLELPYTARKSPKRAIEHTCINRVSHSARPKYKKITIFFISKIPFHTSPFRQISTRDVESAARNKYQCDPRRESEPKYNNIFIANQGRI